MFLDFAFGMCGGVLRHPIGWVYALEEIAAYFGVQHYSAVSRAVKVVDERSVS